MELHSPDASSPDSLSMLSLNSCSHTKTTWMPTISRYEDIVIPIGETTCVSNPPKMRYLRSRSRSLVGP